MTDYEYNYEFKAAKKNTKKEIMETFNSKMRSAFVSGINRAYRWCELWLQDPNNAPLVVNGRKKFTRGYVIGPAVDYFIVKEIIDSGIDLKVKLKYTSKDYPYIVLMDNDESFELTINQTKKPDSTAKQAEFRDNLIDKYQSSLFSIVDESDSAGAEDSKNYFQLTHGYQSEEPKYINLGIPQKNGTWKDYVNIMLLPQTIQKPSLNTEIAEYKNINLSELQGYKYINEVVENE